MTSEIAPQDKPRIAGRAADAATPDVLHRGAHAATLEATRAPLDHAAARCSDQPEFFRLLIDLYNLGLSSPALQVRCAQMWTHFIDEIEAEIRGIETDIVRMLGDITGSLVG